MSPIRRPRNRQSLTPRRSCIALPLLAKRLILSFSLQNRLLRAESRQEVFKVDTQTAPDAAKGWIRRRHASGQSSDGVLHNLVREVGVPAFSFRPVDADDESNNILHFEQGNLIAKVARLKTRQTERYFTCGISAIADADAMETETYIRLTGISIVRIYNRMSAPKILDKQEAWSLRLSGKTLVTFHAIGLVLRV